MTPGRWLAGLDDPYEWRARKGVAFPALMLFYNNVAELRQIRGAIITA